ncbi:MULTISPECIES: MFS transporter [Stenotrophomonas maltophilia group]|uniref:MFS transporter n=1 Tax=Stenotrophomonas maltophilia group TaxID=995085 RepID=UPI000DA8D1A4|nr:MULTISPECIES: MFS transporter [Stenotrophomonas maltophilia group]MBN4959806.1 MFS transporter [Stenotrophomonas maltophilia]MBN4968268.1 MFS transporter [Stenotrophomonas maltophilia]PZT13176.1 MFS transporter [Stenotrophomonas maltophilia]
MSGHAIDAASPAGEATRLPWAGLLALAGGGFITLLTETLPAGVLRPMGESLGVSDAAVGQLVSVYALGSVMAALPMTALTQRLPRRPLLLVAIAGFVVVNTLTALSSSYALILAARFLAGVSGGLLWSLVAGYAARMVVPSLQGRAIAVAMVGSPLALSLGVPAGTLLGQQIGWRWAFALMSVLGLLLLAYARWALPALPAAGAGQRTSLATVWRLPGVRSALLVMALYVLAHNVLYTYIEPLAVDAGAGAWLDRLLLAFGMAAIAGIAMAGWGVDRYLHALVWAAVIGFIVPVLALLVWPGVASALLLATILWGVAFGAVPTLFQTALARRAGAAADLAQSMLVTGWNLAIAAGGVAGGVLLQASGPRQLGWLPLLLLAVTAAWLLARPKAWA